MKLSFNLQKKQIPLYCFMVFFCYLFVFQQISRSFLDEAIFIGVFPILCLANKRIKKIKDYMIPVLLMFLLILFWSTEIHQSFLYYTIMIEAIVFLDPDFEDTSLILRVIKRTAIINSMFVLISRAFPNVMIAYARTVFSESAALGYIKAQEMHYYAGLNNQVAFTAIYISLGIFAYIYDNKISKKSRIVFLCLLGTGLLLTNKRAVLLFAIVAVLGVYFIRAPKGKRLRRFLRILLITLLLIGLLFVASYVFPSNSLVQRMTGLITAVINGGDLNSALSGRLAIYKQLIELFKDHKLLGVGWQNFADYSRYRSVTGGVNQGHNVFLQLLCETGVVGFILFMALNIYYVVFNYKTNVAGAIFYNKVLGDKERNLDCFSKCALSFMMIYYMIWFSGNALYDFTCVYVWVVSILITIANKKKMIDNVNTNRN